MTSLATYDRLISSVEAHDLYKICVELTGSCTCQRLNRHPCDGIIEIDNNGGAKSELDRIEDERAQAGEDIE